MVKNAYSADFGGDVVVDDVAGDSVILSIAPDIESVLYYGTCVVTGQSVVWTAMDNRNHPDLRRAFPGRDGPAAGAGSGLADRAQQPCLGLLEHRERHLCLQAG